MASIFYQFGPTNWDDAHKLTVARSEMASAIERIDTRLRELDGSAMIAGTASECREDCSMCDEGYAPAIVRSPGDALAALPSLPTATVEINSEPYEKCGICGCVSWSRKQNRCILSEAHVK